MTPLFWYLGERAAGCIVVGATILRLSIFVRGVLLASIDQPKPSDLDTAWRWLRGEA